MAIDMSAVIWARNLWNQAYTDAMESELDSLVYEFGWFEALPIFLRGLNDDIEAGKA